MKIFEVEGFNITIEDDLFDAAVKCYALEPGNNSEEKRGNYLYLQNALRAGSCETLEDLGCFSFEKLRKEISDEEASKIVKRMIIRTMDDYGYKDFILSDEQLKGSLIEK